MEIILLLEAVPCVIGILCFLIVNSLDAEPNTLLALFHLLDEGLNLSVTFRIIFAFEVMLDEDRDP